MTKLVTLGTGRTFPTITAAKKHFAAILKAQELNQTFSASDFADIESVYLDYCAKTGWDLPFRPYAFYPTHDRGPGYSTRCFGVTFVDGKVGTFSMDRALRAIAA